MKIRKVTFYDFVIRGLQKKKLQAFVRNTRAEVFDIRETGFQAERG